MASTSEVGHAKNLANLQKLIDLVTQIGATYNPSNPQITVAGLTTTQTQCTTDFNNYETKFVTYKADTNNREIGFEPISKLCTDILNNVKTLNIPQQTLDDVSSIVSKIHGEVSKLKPDTNTTGTTPTPTPTPTGGGTTTTPVTPPPTEKTTPTTTTPTPTSNTISTSHRSFDNILANFQKLIQQLQSMSAYSPNEVSIKTATLLTQYTGLQTLNIAAITATNAAALARNQRNLTFYANSTGMVDITKKVKYYIRQIEGSNSAIYHQATAIKFVKYNLVSKKKKKKK